MHGSLELDFKKKKCMYLFVYGCAGSLLLCGLFSGAANGGSSLVAGLLTAVASLLGHAGFRACRMWARKLRAQ